MSTLPPRRTRVVVTGEEQGRSVVLSDETTTGEVQDGYPYAYNDLWSIASLPPAVDETGEWPTGPYEVAPRTGGLNFRVVQMTPMSAWSPSQEMSAGAIGDSQVDSTASPFMHKTDTVDFGLVLEGTVTMVLDDDVVEVAAGGVIVQRGTTHAWENRTEESVVVAFVMIGATRPDAATD